MGAVLCFGELLLRLSAPGHERLLQTPRLQVQVGGAEANVAVSLARFGHDARVASVLPANALGDAALAELRRHGVDTRPIRRGPGRMGLYFLETGALQRPSEVLYDRAGSAFAVASADAINWTAALDGAAHLHLSGITPALGEAPAQAALRAARTARAAGVTVSFDGNYRASLWQQREAEAPPLLRELFAQADLLFADHRDLAMVLGLSVSGDEPAAQFAAAASAAFEAFPQLQCFATTRRGQHSVTQHVLSAFLATRDGGVHAAPARDLPGVVDRIGAGDAFAAGVLHRWLQGAGAAETLAFGLAAACLKHSIPGDFNLVDAAAVEALLASSRLDVKR